ncbi:WD40 repeat domain-containing protein [Streptomyces mirabilis]|uniref:WD40 repeat domain-containing protein n=1 Tax=Streptomyces mirabilis TaxID=68239 RepID=UPI0009429139
MCRSHDGRHLATAGDDGQVLLRDPTNGRPRHVLEGDGSAMRSVAVSRDGTSLVAVTMDGTAHLWDTGTAVEVCRLRVDGHLSSCPSTRTSIASSRRLGGPVRV